MKSSKNNTKQRKSSKRDLEKARKIRIIREIDNAGAQQRIVSRTFTSQSTITSTAGGVLPLTSFNSGAVQTLPATEWSSYSGRYSEYRVKAMKVSIFPTRRANVSGATTNPPAFVACASYASNNAGTTVASILSAADGTAYDGYRPFTVTTDNSGNVDARDWTATTGSITAADTYGIILAFPQTPLQDASYVYFWALTEWLVEFRTQL